MSDNAGNSGGGILPAVSDEDQSAAGLSHLHHAQLHNEFENKAELFNFKVRFDASNLNRLGTFQCN